METHNNNLACQFELGRASLGAGEAFPTTSTVACKQLQAQ